MQSPTNATTTATPTQQPRQRQSTTLGASATARRAPLASHGDAFDLYVDVLTHRSTPVAFVNLTLDYDALSRASPSAQLAVNLADCLLALNATGASATAGDPCSVVARITWVTHGVSFTARTPLTRTLPARIDADGVLRNATSTHTYLQPTLTLSPIVDFATPPSPLHAAMVPDVPGAPALYGPAVYVNNFWLLRKHLRVLPQACSPAGWCNVTVHVAPTRAWKVALYEQLDASARQQVTMGVASDTAADELKSIFLDTSPYLLAVTALVTMLHMLFEFLALSNDVQFWRNRRDLSGLSVRSIVVNCYFETIIFLYLLDSSEQTSWAILAPAGIGVCMQYWKLAQTLTLQRTPHGDGNDDGNAGNRCARALRSVTRYRLAFKQTYNAQTRKHDEDAVRWLVYLMVPALAGYSAYSALYLSHKSWYSYLISTQVQFIYAFGFAMMTPQIFINYKLKSVGQLPWRTFVYKALNTVIDDLFAFVIQMPWLHRLACFRDDVVFAVLLYQRYIYPVDPTRHDDSDGTTDDDSHARQRKQQ